MQSENSHNKNTTNFVQNWYKLQGQKIAQLVDNNVNNTTKNYYGYCAVASGFLSIDWTACKIHTKITLHENFPTIALNKNNQSEHLVANCHDLPICNHALDLYISSHQIDLTKNLPQLLNEIDRTLMPDGELLIIGFNRTYYNCFSMFLAKKMLPQTPNKTKEILWYLSLLSYEVKWVKYPKAKNSMEYIDLAFSDRKYKKWQKILMLPAVKVLGYVSPVYIIRAKKSTEATLPLKLKKNWRNQIKKKYAKKPSYALNNS